MSLYGSNVNGKTGFSLEEIMLQRLNNFQAKKQLKKIKSGDLTIPKDINGLRKTIIDTKTRLKFT